MTDAQSLIQTVATGAATPGHAAAPPSGHDFAALVDRLVEAREAAVPQAVTAAIAHSDFGQVSLRFDHGADGLSVAMSSTDPDFARAVQAGTASAAADTPRDDSAASPRQDTPSQQSAGSPLGQQAFARGERDARANSHAGETRPAAPGREQSPGDAAADPRGGVYA